MSYFQVHYFLVALTYSFPTRHVIRSGVWSSQNLAYYERRGYTIRDAIDYWYWNVSDTDKGIAFRDVCSGPRCNDGCPEELTLEGDRAVVWSAGAKIAIAALVMAIATLCLLLKVYTPLCVRHMLSLKTKWDYVHNVGGLMVLCTLVLK